MILFLKHQIFNRLLIFAFFCSVPLAFYTAFAISISNFSIYNMPLELMHFSFNSFALGSSFILFFVDRDDIKFLVAKVLLCSILVLFFIHISSYMFADMNSLEISQMIAPIKMHGEYFNIFWITISFSFITPMFLITLSLVNKSANILPLASLLSISGILLLEYIYIVLI
jgi:hypothetical protein